MKWSPLQILCQMCTPKPDEQATELPQFGTVPATRGSPDSSEGLETYYLCNRCHEDTQPTPQENKDES